MKKLFLIMAAVALSFAGCKSITPEIEGDWQTAKLEINGVEQELVMSEITLTQKDGAAYSIDGDSGVNRFFGDVKVSGSSFKVQDNIGSTKMAGDPASMKFEDIFIQALLSASLWEKIDEGSSVLLKLTDKNGKHILTFTKK